MKVIKQKHKNACGVACLAMVMNITYRRAMKLLHPKRFWWFSDTTTELVEIVDVLETNEYELDFISPEQNISFTDLKIKLF